MTDATRTGLVLAALAVTVALGPGVLTAAVDGGGLPRPTDADGGVGCSLPPVDDADAPADERPGDDSPADDRREGRAGDDRTDEPITDGTPDEDADDPPDEDADEGTPEDGYDPYPPHAAGIEIQTVYEGPVSVTLVRDPGGAAVTTFARRYPERRTVLQVGESTAPGADYRVRVRAGCEVVWDRTVHSHERFTLRVGEDGSVEVLSHAVR